ncbi:MAG: dTMP kinase [Chloroflexi bacterium]|nr:dTMP kinase [Chloroflexota bacterium]
MAGDNFFIVIEGLDGAGKTGIARQLFSTLSQTHQDHVALTYEPHDPSAAGMYIRNALTKRIKVSPLSLALAFALNRADHIDQVIEPFFSAGSEPRTVICDRYVMSSLVYQSTGGLSMEDIEGLNRCARQPDLTLFLNVSPRQCYARLRNRPADRELFEKNLAERADKYQTAVQLLRDKGENIVEIDANPGFNDVFAAVLSAIQDQAPDWLRIQQPLLLDVEESNADDDFDISEAELYAWVNALSHEQLEEAGPQHLNWLFKAYLLDLGFAWGERLTWTPTPAHILFFQLPTGLEQRGIALVSNSKQQTDIATKLVQDQRDRAIGRDSAYPGYDFIILLDKAQFEPLVRFDRDNSLHKGLAPQVQIITRQTLLDWLRNR